MVNFVFFCLLFLFVYKLIFCCVGLENEFVLVMKFFDIVVIFEDLFEGI